MLAFSSPWSPGRAALPDQGLGPAGWTADDWGRSQACILAGQHPWDVRTAPRPLGGCTPFSVLLESLSASAYAAGEKDFFTRLRIFLLSYPGARGWDPFSAASLSA